MPIFCLAASKCIVSMGNLEGLRGDRTGIAHIWSFYGSGGRGSAYNGVSRRGHHGSRWVRRQNARNSSTWSYRCCCEQPRPSNPTIYDMMIRRSGTNVGQGPFRGCSGRILHPPFAALTLKTPYSLRAMFKRHALKKIFGPLGVCEGGR